MKILITGGTGFIGRNMVEHFAALGHDVHATYLTKNPPNDGHNVTWFHVDLRIRLDLERYDIIIHAAATTSGSKDICNTPAIHVTDNAVMGSYIFRACAEAKVKHVIFFSCTVMYPDGECVEETPASPNPKYFGVAHTKLYLEKMAEFYANTSDTRFTVVRHSNCYGSFDKYDLEHSHVTGASIAKVMTATDKVTIWGTGEEKRDLLYVSDLCEFVQAAIEKQSRKFGLYNAGAGYAVSINHLVERIIGVSRKKLKISHDLTAPSIPTSLWLNCAKAKRELGWEPKVTLDDGIAKTIDWYKQNVQ